MKQIELLMCLVVLISIASGASGVTMTFDDIPEGMIPGEYYSVQHGIGLDGAFIAVDYTGSTWGQPHSGKNVMIWNYPGYGSNFWGMMFKRYPEGPIYASSVGGYFSTKPGVVLEMIGYHDSLVNPVASVIIGSSGQSLHNVQFNIRSASGIGIVEFKPVTANALEHFCADDITVNFVPEPSSILTLLGGLAGIGGIAFRRKNK